MGELQVRHYLRRATDFYDGMQLTRNDEPYRNSAALLAIHSAISFCDALRTGLGEIGFATDDHNRAADALKQRIPTGLMENSGIDHLRFLIQNKSSIAYGNRRLETKTFGLLLTRAERFAAWANIAGKKLNIRGWHDDN